MICVVNGGRVVEIGILGLRVLWVGLERVIGVGKGDGSHGAGSYGDECGWKGLWGRWHRHFFTVA